MNPPAPAAGPRRDDRPLRIDFFVSTAHEQGTYFRFHNLALGLKMLGQHVNVWACDQDPASAAREEFRDGVRYRIVPSSRATGLFTSAAHPITALRRCMIDYEPCDIAHLFQPFANAAVPWRLCAPRIAWRRVYDWDDLWEGGLLSLTSPQYFRDRWFRGTTSRLERSLPRIADAVTTCSADLAERAVERGAREVGIVHNGYWPFQPLDRLTARAKLGLRSVGTYVGFMGRTTAELDWCLDALKGNLDRAPKLRLALCGVADETVNGVSPILRDRIDHLGQLSAAQTRDFAAALDVGLLPLEDNAFNRSRFPIKYAEYLAAGAPVLASEVGECAALSRGRAAVLPAGKSREAWMSAFAGAVERADRGAMPSVDRAELERSLSWRVISERLLQFYRLIARRDARCS